LLHFVPHMQAARARAALVGLSDPFPGLRPFRSDEELIFRGRQQHTEELLRRLSVHRFLAVVGTSGSGKSSLVRAGLLPALDRGYLAGATSRWRIAVMRPGMAPIGNLADALRRAKAAQAADEGKLRSSRLGLAEAVKDAGLAAGESLLVVVDQFEELFFYQQRMTEIDGGEEAALFVSLLLAAVARPDAPIYVVLTMRSDFLGDCAQFPGLPEALSESQYLIPRLTREQRREAIEEPLRLFGTTMTPELVEQLLNDSGEEGAEPGSAVRYRGGTPDPLPVLQHALMRTYLEWGSSPLNEADGPIDLTHYAKAGRMESALDQHAERVFTEELDDAGRGWAERILRCLTTTELGRPVRRPTRLRDLYRVVGARAQDQKKVDELLEAMQRPKNSFIKVNTDTTVDISHESLIWKWRRLGDWVAKEAAGAELYRDLLKDANRGATWVEPKLSGALAVRNQDAWNADWGRQYSESRFDEMEAFLLRSRKAALYRKAQRSLAAVAFALIVILAVVAYYNYRLAMQKARDFDALTVVRDGLASERDKLKHNETALSNRIAGLSISQGATEEERDRIATEKMNLEAQLLKSREASQVLEAQAQQSTNLLASVKSIQSRLDQAQRQRDDAAQGQAVEAKKRRDAESRVAQLEVRVNSLENERNEAVQGLAVEVKKGQDAENNLAQIKVPGRSTNPGTQVAPGESRKNPRDGLDYVWIPAGEFRMGCSLGDKDCDPDEKPPHQVSIAKGFWLGQTEVTQRAYESLMRENPSTFKGKDFPVESVTFDEASAYCKAAEGRLPSEAEWEYAARAGSTMARYGQLDAIAWFNGNSQGIQVGRKKQANAWGLYDMLGNVWEWVTDWFSPDYSRSPSSSAVDPKGRRAGAMHVVRGGSWMDYATAVRASSRGKLGGLSVVDMSQPPVSRRSRAAGFRCAWDPKVTIP
jgi:formylglycine-generating enzyme required for sulfatase activity